MLGRPRGTNPEPGLSFAVGCWSTHRSSGGKEKSFAITPVHGTETNNITTLIKLTSNESLKAAHLHLQSKMQTERHNTGTSGDMIIVLKNN